MFWRLFEWNNKKLSLELQRMLKEPSTPSGPFKALHWNLVCGNGNSITMRNKNEQLWWNIYDSKKRVLWTLPSCNGSIVCIISCSKPCRNFCPVAVCAVLLPGALPLDPGGPERLSDAARDVTEPPGCVAIDVSDELAAFPLRIRRIRIIKAIEKN